MVQKGSALERELLLNVCALRRPLGQFRFEFFVMIVVVLALGHSRVLVVVGERLPVNIASLFVLKNFFIKLVDLNGTLRLGHGASHRYSLGRLRTLDPDLVDSEEVAQWVDDVSRVIKLVMLHVFAEEHVRLAPRERLQQHLDRVLVRYHGVLDAVEDYSRARHLLGRLKVVEALLKQ